MEKLIHTQANKKFGTVIRELRWASGKSISQITKGMNWSKSYLMELESGRSSPPTKDKIDKLANILGIDSFYLFAASIQDRGKITLPISNKPKQAQFAALLFCSWNDIDETQIEEIEGILNRVKCEE